MDHDLSLSLKQADLTGTEILHLCDEGFGEGTTVIRGLTHSAVDCGCVCGRGRNERREARNAAGYGDCSGGERASTQEVSTAQAGSPIARLRCGLATPIAAHGHLPLPSPLCIRRPPRGWMSARAEFFVSGDFCGPTVGPRKGCAGTLQLHPSHDRPTSNNEPMDASSRRFAGKVAVVTGSTADPSIGRSCAVRLAREGAAVVINGRDPTRLSSAEASMRAEGLEVIGVLGSMETETGVKMLVDRTVETFGGVDLVVSTLGGAPHPRPFDVISESELLDTMRVNTWPAVALIRAALSRGLAERAGSVVTISSGSPRKTTSSMVSYAAAKAALNAMTRTLAADLAPRGVRVNAVSPGLVRTTATRSAWEADGGRAAGAALPMGRLTEADDVAGTVAFLLSDDARQITGISVDVDGGNHLRTGGWTPIR